MAEPIIVPSRHKVRVDPLPSGSCRIEIDATVPWDTAIEVIKALGYLGKLTSLEQAYADGIRGQKRQPT